MFGLGYILALNETIGDFAAFLLEANTHFVRSKNRQLFFFIQLFYSFDAFNGNTKIN